MFTGIIEELGVVEKILPKKNLLGLSIKAKKIQKGIKPGDSVSVNGVCLTVTSLAKGTLSFDVMKETIEKTALADLKPRSFVNLERAMTPKSRFGGHFVTGHTDCVGTITGRIKQKNYLALQIAIPKAFTRYLVAKGSVCVDGISLTIGKVQKANFAVHLIPFTLKATTLGLKTIGDKVNIETDILAKYILSGRS